MNRSTNKNHIVHHTRTTGPCKLHIYPCKKPYNQRHEPILRSEIHKTWAEYRIIGLDQKSNAAPFTDLDFPAQFGLTSFPKSK